VIIDEEYEISILVNKKSIGSANQYFRRFCFEKGIILGGKGILVEPLVT